MAILSRITLEELSKEVLNNFKNTIIYRDATASKLTHEFELTAAGLRKQVLMAFSEDPSKLSRSIKDKALKYSKTFINSVNSSFNSSRLSKNYTIEDLGSTNSKLHFLVSSTNGSNVYRYILDKFRGPKTKLYDSLVKLYSEEGISTRDSLGKNSFLDLSHERGSQIGRNAADLIINSINDFFSARPGISRTEVNTLKTELEANFKNTSNMYVTFLAFSKNRGEDSKKDKAAYNKDITKLKNILSTYTKQVSYEAVEQEVLHSLASEFRKVDKAKLKGFKLYNIKKELKKIEEKKVKTTKNKTSQLKAVRGILARSNKVNLKVLLGIINRQLPSKIASNMGSPALNYRTGRFAQSARLVDASITEKNGISLAYTYQKDPYQLFEPGRSHLATPARDPKKIIGNSVRELAAKLVSQRFYVKRL